MASNGSPISATTMATTTTKISSNGNGCLVHSSGINSNKSTNFGLHHHHVHHVIQHVHHVHYQEPYELSQDLVAKQLELLEKKYGGASKANEAALTITRAFRRSVHTYFLLIFF